MTALDYEVEYAAFGLYNKLKEVAARVQQEQNSSYALVYIIIEVAMVSKKRVSVRVTARAPDHCSKARYIGLVAALDALDSAMSEEGYGRA